MRRKDREIIDPNEILSIMERCDVCNLACMDGEYPYVLPMNFGVQYAEGIFTLYFHSANTGTKLDLLRKHGQAAFTMSCAQKLLLQENACNSTMEYESVCGRGTIRFLSEAEKTAGLASIMAHYVPGKEFRFAKPEIDAVTVLALTIAHISGKKHKI